LQKRLKLFGGHDCSFTRNKAVQTLSGSTRKMVPIGADSILAARARAGFPPTEPGDGTHFKA
jgi:hypothetical protein